MTKIAIMGFGTIGSGVAEVIEKNASRLKKTCGDDIELKYVLDVRDFEGTPIEKKIVHDYKVIANDPEIAIVVETMGGVEPAYTFVKEMLLNGKHVVTSNKNLVAEKGAELIELAKQKSINFLFEASVGGGIPIIRPLMSSITGDEVLEVSGIVNGTTNYMLTKMMSEGSDFDEVLKEAQEKGYAEKDPTADVEGLDACRKIAILTSVVCGQQVNYQDIHTEGITKITAADMAYAKAMNRTIKLLATSKEVGDGYVALVAPFLVPSDHPLYGVNGVFNAIFVKGNMLDDCMFYGRGAGKLPTASAVVGDIVDCIKHHHTHIILVWDSKPVKLKDYKMGRAKFFIRTAASVAEVEAAFGSVEIVKAEGVTGETGAVTAIMTEEEYDKCAEKLSAGIKQMIRMK